MSQGGNFNDMEDTEFFSNAIKPYFPNTMKFVLTRPPDNPPDQTFSVDGVEKIVDQFKRFMLARIYGTWSKTKKAPSKMEVTVSFDFTEVPSKQQLEDGFGPWYHLVDESGNSIDAYSRHDPKRKR